MSRSTFNATFNATFLNEKICLTALEYWKEQGYQVTKRWEKILNFRLNDSDQLTIKKNAALLSVLLKKEDGFINAELEITEHITY